MNGLIKITTNEQGSSVVSARELYEYLGFDAGQWKRWYQKNIINNQFAFENVDWEVFDIMSNTKNGGRPTKDFAITTDFAKRLSMMARTEKGEEARKYFIECEQKLTSAEPRKLSNLEILELAMQAERANIELQNLNNRLQQHNEQLQPKADYADKVLNSESGHATTIIAKELGMSAIELNQILCGMGIQYRTKSQEWVLTAKYQNCGYVESRTHAYLSSDKFTTKTKIYFVWTELGRKFIHETIKKRFETIGQVKLN
jgi:anti-repressor protein